MQSSLSPAIRQLHEGEDEYLTSEERAEKERIKRERELQEFARLTYSLTLNGKVKDRERLAARIGEDVENLATSLLNAHDVITLVKGVATKVSQRDNEPSLNQKLEENEDRLRKDFLDVAPAQGLEDKDFSKEMRTLAEQIKAGGSEITLSQQELTEKLGKARNDLYFLNQYLAKTESTLTAVDLSQESFETRKELRDAIEDIRMARGRLTLADLAFARMQSLRLQKGLPLKEEREEVLPVDEEVANA